MRSERSKRSPLRGRNGPTVCWLRLAKTGEPPRATYREGQCQRRPGIREFCHFISFHRDKCTTRSGIGWTARGRSCTCCCCSSSSVPVMRLSLATVNLFNWVLRTRCLAGQQARHNRRSGQGRCSLGSPPASAWGRGGW